MSKKPPPIGSLYKRTLQLLEGRSLEVVVRETHLPFYWLQSILAGKVRNPSVNRIQHLYEYLSNSRLEL